MITKFKIFEWTNLFRIVNPKDYGWTYNGDSYILNMKDIIWAKSKYTKYWKLYRHNGIWTLNKEPSGLGIVKTFKTLTPNVMKEIRILIIKDADKKFEESKQI